MTSIGLCHGGFGGGSFGGGGFHGGSPRGFQGGNMSFQGGRFHRPGSGSGSDSHILIPIIHTTRIIRTPIGRIRTLRHEHATGFAGPRLPEPGNGTGATAQPTSPN
jgi:hypothetical protein